MSVVKRSSMSNFSEKLKLHIETSGVKIYQLAKISGLDRTTIQYMISGKRIPGRDFVEKLVTYLKISPFEKEELFELYSISKIGETIYHGRKYIKGMIEGLATSNTIDNNLFASEKRNFINEDVNTQGSVYEGKHIVNNMIRAVIEEEVFNNSSPQINLSVPINHSFLYDLLYQIYLIERGQVVIKSITRFNKKDAYQDSNYNLKILSHTIPFAFSAGDGYQVYYYYDNYDSSSDVAALMPYYIITSKQLITLSGDYNSAILYHNQDIINIYKRSFEVALGNSTSLIRQHFNCDDLIMAYVESLEKCNRPAYIVEPQPCFAFYYTDEIIDAHLRQGIENREILLEKLLHFYAQYKNCTQRPSSLFSIEGLSYFAATGRLADLPIEYAIPFTIEERIMMMSRLREDILSSEYKAYVVDSTKLLIPICSIQVYPMDGIEIYRADNNGIMSSAFVKETSIADAFADFFESLSKSHLVFDNEESVKVIDNLIEECRKAITT